METVLYIWQLLLIVLVAGEWVEIPQSSQTRKYYFTRNQHSPVSQSYKPFMTENPHFINYVKSNVQRGIPLTLNDSGILPEVHSDLEFKNRNGTTVGNTNMNHSLESSNSDRINITNDVTTEDAGEIVEDEDETVEDEDETVEDEDENIEDDDETHKNENLTAGDNDEGETSPKPNGFSLAGFLPFLKHVQETFMGQTPKGVKGKIKLLEHFRDNLLLNIEDRIHGIWPDNRTGRHTREARLINHYGYDDGQHMEFPSAEGALITISFLTFAVFLIKLVLQVIQLLKSKSAQAMTVTGPTAMSATNQIKTFRNARRMSGSDHDIQNVARIMSLMDKYNIQ